MLECIVALGKTITAVQVNEKSAPEHENTCALSSSERRQPSPTGNTEWAQYIQIVNVNTKSHNFKRSVQPRSVIFWSWCYLILR
jgi:hypothetical protein